LGDPGSDDPPPLAGLASDSLQGIVLAGRYELGRPLGTGGAGHVYRALQQPLGREVAV
jgi:serine/threonine protein kinase